MTNGADPRSEFKQLIYETPAPGVVRMVMNRPDKRNAQGRTLTYELDAAFRKACHDDAVSVVILAGAGDHFNAGHDFTSADGLMPEPGQAVGLWGQYGGPGWEGHYSREKETYLEMTERWRNAPKPTIAEVQGAVISGGLALAWCCDLIVCSRDARFRDSTPLETGVPGIEFFQHAYEMGVRKAKEFLFTSDWLSADEAERRGMVNHVVESSELPGFTLDLARRVARTDRFVLKLLKEAVNHAQDSMGRRSAMDQAFALHQIGHLQNMLVHDFLIDASKLPEGMQKRIPELREAMRLTRPAR